MIDLRQLTPDEIADLRITMTHTDGDWQTVEQPINVYEDLTPEQAADLYRWGSDVRV